MICHIKTPPDQGRRSRGVPKFYTCAKALWFYKLHFEGVLHAKALILLRGTNPAGIANVLNEMRIHGNLAAMIRNGLYSVISKILDGIEGNSIGVSVVQDGTMRGGGSIYYHIGSYTCSNGKWKGELTVREHEPAQVTELFARKVVTMGFMGTYDDDGAEFEATALVGKRSARLKMVLRLLIPDQVDGEVR